MPDEPVRGGEWPRRVCRSHPVAAFLVLTFALSWPFMAAFRDSALAVPVVGVPPSAAAFIAAALARGRAGVRSLAARVLLARVGLRWWVLALFAMGAAVWAAAYGATAALYPGSLTAPPAGMLLGAPLNFAAIFVLAGLGEEFGWRGLAQERLQRRWGALPAALAVGATWFGWHLPLNVGEPDWVPLQTAFFFGVVADAVILAWLFNRSGGSVLLVTAMHAASNTWGGVYYAGVFSFEPPGFVAFEAVRSACYAAVALAVIAATRGRLGAGPPAEGTGAAAR
ncbi:lysostaphin resistance A-like protein [Nocardiopsis coralliicola]